MYDGQEITSKARKSFLDSFLKQVDEHTPGLSEAERQRRAEALKKAHFQRMAYKSAQARRKG